MFSEEYKAECDRLSYKIIGAAIEVHKNLGAGLLESAYEACLCYELANLNLSFQRQVSLGIDYKGMKLDVGFKLDIIVEDLIIIELKSVEAITSLHKAQLMTYLKITGKWLGLIINLNTTNIKYGVQRVVVG